MKQFSKKCTSLLGLFLIFIASSAQVWTYNYPDTIVNTASFGKNYRSQVYQVKVIQNETEYNSYVLADYNPVTYGSRSKMTDYNHSTCFSFKGIVKVEITKIGGGSITGVKVYPLAKQIPFELEGDKKIIITLDEPHKLYVEMDGMDKDPLFIFADPPEAFSPSEDDPDVELISPGMTAAEVKTLMNTTSKSIIYFQKGIHSYGDKTDDSYDGYQLPMLSNKKYYIPGGAYLRGSLYGSSVSNTGVYGRGIISACGLNVSDEFKNNMVFFDGGGSDHIIEGITITDPSHYCILSRGNLDCSNVKLFGWWYSTDGFGGNHNSHFYDSFTKVNDDHIKVYRDNQLMENIVIYKQINGAALQLGWNAYGAAHNSVVKNIYIIKDDPKTPSTPSNTAVINLKNNNGSEILSVLFDSIYIENDVQRTIGIHLQGGFMNLVTIRNLFHTGNNNAQNYIFAEDGGTINTITFYNIKQNGQCILSNEDWNLNSSGQINHIFYDGCPQSVSAKETEINNQNFLIMSGLQKKEIIIKTDATEPYHVIVHNITGKLVCEMDHLSGNHSIPIENNGIFLVTILSGNKSYSNKTVIF